MTSKSGQYSLCARPSGPPRRRCGRPAPAGPACGPGPPGAAPGVGQRLRQGRLRGRRRQGAVGRQVHERVDPGDGYLTHPLQAPGGAPAAGRSPRRPGGCPAGPPARAVADLGVLAELAQQLQALLRSPPGRGRPGSSRRRPSGRSRPVAGACPPRCCRRRGPRPGRSRRAGPACRSRGPSGRSPAGSRRPRCWSRRRPGRPDAEHGVVQGGHLRVAGRCRLPGRDHLGQGRVSGQDSGPVVEGQFGLVGEVGVSGCVDGDGVCL